MRHSFLPLLFACLLLILLPCYVNSDEDARREPDYDPKSLLISSLSDEQNLQLTNVDYEKYPVSIDTPELQTEEKKKEEVAPSPAINKCTKFCHNNQLVWWSKSVIPEVPKGAFFRLGLEDKEIETEVKNLNDVKTSINDRSFCNCVNENVSDFFLQESKALKSLHVHDIFTKVGTDVNQLKGNIETAKSITDFSINSAGATLMEKKGITENVHLQFYQLKSCIVDLRYQNDIAAIQKIKLQKKGISITCDLPNHSTVFPKETKKVKEDMKKRQQIILDELVRVSVYYQHYINRFSEHNSKCWKNFFNKTHNTECKEKNNLLPLKTKKYIKNFLDKTANKIQILFNHFKTGSKMAINENEKKNGDIQEQTQEKILRTIRIKTNIEEINVNIATIPFDSGLKYYFAILPSKRDNNCPEECGNINMVLSSAVNFTTVLPSFVQYNDALNNEIKATITSNFTIPNNNPWVSHCFCEDGLLKLHRLNVISLDLLEDYQQDYITSQLYNILESYYHFLDRQKVLTEIKKVLKQVEAEIREKWEKCDIYKTNVTEANKLMQLLEESDLRTNGAASLQGKLKTLCEQNSKIKIELDEKLKEQHIFFLKKTHIGDVRLNKYYKKLRSTIEKFMYQYMDTENCRGTMVSKWDRCVRMYPNKKGRMRFPFMKDDLDEELKVLFENHKDLGADTELKELKDEFDTLINEYRTNFLDLTEENEIVIEEE